MAYRANLFDFGAVAGAAGGANAAVNDAAIAAAMASPVNLIEVEPEVFEISQTVVNGKNGKRFRGSGKPDVFASLSDGVTRFDWWGATGGTMAKLSPFDAMVGKDLIGASFEQMTFNGRSIAGVGLVDEATRRTVVEDVSAAYVTSTGVIFRKLPAGQGNINVSYRPHYNRVSVNVNGGATGILLDGITFGSIDHFHTTHLNGVGIYMRNCDDVHFYNPGTSRGGGGTGISVMFDGAQGTPVLGCGMWGLHCGAHDGDVRIYSRGPLARGNDILFLSGVDNKDNQPIITIEPASELYYNFVGRSIYPPTTPTLALEKALRRMPKRNERTY
jgi:hypothetical protein